jgi:6-phosphogluconolactonase
MKPDVQILADPAALCRVAAERFVSAAKSAVAANGRFTVVLSGGSTPKTLYSLLANDVELRAQVPWQLTYFFFGDERNVAPVDPDSNYRMAYEALLSKAPVDASHVFRMKGELQDTEEAATDYERVLREFFRPAEGELPRFDLVFLGMGPDGHTASLFPMSGALNEQQKLVKSNWVEKLHTYRITLTAPVLNAAAQVIFLVQGPDKAQSLKAVLQGAYQPQSLPSQLIRPSKGSLLWLVDSAAAALLDKKSLSK